MSEAYSEIKNAESLPENTESLIPPSDFESDPSLIRDSLGIAFTSFSIVASGLQRTLLESRLEKQATSKVAQEAADRFTNMVPDENPMRSGRLKYRDLDPELAPINVRQRVKADRSGARQARANNVRSSGQYRLKKIFGSDIGTEDFKERVKSSRMSKSERRRALRAHKKYNKLSKKADKLEGRVKDVAEGKSVLTRSIEKKVAEVGRRSDELQTKIERKTEQIDQAKAKKESLKERRSVVWHNTKERNIERIKKGARQTVKSREFIRQAVVDHIQNTRGAYDEGLANRPRTHSLAYRAGQKYGLLKRKRSHNKTEE